MGIGTRNATERRGKDMVQMSTKRKVQLGPGCRDGR